MACEFEYSCKVPVIGTLLYHNVLINDEKWHLAQNAGTGGAGYTEEQVLKKIKESH